MHFKRGLGFLAAGLTVLTLVLAGCGEETPETHGNKETKDTPEKIETEPEESEEVRKETEEEIPGSYDFVLGGSSLTGYAEVPADWNEYTTGPDDGYAVIYANEGETAIISFLTNQYGFEEIVPEDYDEGDYFDAEEVVEYVLAEYIAAYEDAGLIHESIEEVSLNGQRAWMSVDYYPAGVYADYDYYSYTYIAMQGIRFYTIIVEGGEQNLNGVRERVEETFLFAEADAGGMEHHSTVNTGSGGWESYYVVLNGEEYTLPCDFSRLNEDGWRIESSYRGRLIEPDDFISVYIQNSDLETMIILGNPDGDAALAVENAQVVGIDIGWDLIGTDSCLPGIIELGMSYEEVIANLGAPDLDYLSDEDSDEDYYFRLLTYYDSTAWEEDYFSSLEISFDENGVSEIDIRHW